jgi:predicted glycosyltransferase
LVTAGGGGDGELLIDWVLSTYEQGCDLRWPALMVFGPFMPSQIREQFEQRAALLPNVETMTFESNFEFLMEKASAVVAMGGYNTFCEILSLDKRALIVPRTIPREEQLLRARRAAELGLITMLTEEDACQPNIMAEHINALANLQLPSQTVEQGFLSGLENIVDTTRELLSALK